MPEKNITKYIRNETNAKEYYKLHEGTLHGWYLFGTKELDFNKDQINIFTILCKLDDKLDPHSQPCPEFYYILHGRGVVRIDDEEEDVYAGDLIYTPPNHVHSLRVKTKGYPLIYFCFGGPLPDENDDLKFRERTKPVQ